MYPIIEIPAYASERLEEVGSKDKFWYEKHTKMFKAGRDNTGEHWAEKIACELCRILGLPFAHYEFARWRGKLGTTTDNIVPENGRLDLGNVHLVSFSDSYDKTQKYRSRQHTVGRVMAALGSEGVLRPAQCDAAIPLVHARDIFTGYILLDAWIGNTDRHHENWGLITDGNSTRLAPTFDHASSLGRELSDEVRLSRLGTADERYSVAAYASRATSALYRTESDKRPLSTVDAYREVAKKCPEGAAFWSTRLSTIAPNQIQAILDEVPPEVMSEPARRFVKQILAHNQTKICSTGD